MQFILPAETFVRLSKAAARPTDDVRPWLACVRLEHRDGKSYAIASTSWVLAVEYLGDTSEPDGFVNVPLDDTLMACLAMHHDDVVFEWFEAFGVLTCPTFGALALTAMEDREPMFTRWFEIFPSTLPKADKGFLFIQAEYFQRLTDSSPSGCLAFPAVVDSSRVVIVRDVHDDNWCGVFLAADKQKRASPATKPEWMP